jgi:hypothetical protein
MASKRIKKIIENKNNKHIIDEKPIYERMKCVKYFLYNKLYYTL